MLPVIKMGVINLTPDSFSDGSPDLDCLAIKNKIISQNQWADIIDFGAQSSAPFNSQISISEEISRLEKLLIPNLKHIKTKSISIDTYYTDVFEFVYNYIRESLPHIDIIFNDVSGVVDSKLLSLLAKNRDFKYILNNTFVESRHEMLSHMNKCIDKDGEEFYKDFVSMLDTNLNKLSDHHDRLFLDPGFGFSKTRKQNHYLLSKLEDLTQNYKIFDFLIAISRKSFLRFPENMNPKLEANQRNLDSLAAMLMNNWCQVIKKPLIYRVHDNSSFELIETYNTLKSEGQ